MQISIIVGLESTADALAPSNTERRKEAVGVTPTREIRKKTKLIRGSTVDMGASGAQFFSLPNTAS